MKYSNCIDQRLTGRHKKSFRFVNDVTGKVILDIGCSYGWFEKWAIENNCKRIIGIEPNINDFQDNRKTVQNAIFIQGSVLNIPSKDEYFDMVVMWEVLEHLPKNTEIQAFKEIGRVLKSGGSLFLSTPNDTFWSCVLDPAWWIAGHRHYAFSQLNKMVAESGLEIVKVEYGGGFWELFSMIMLYIYKWIFRREMPFKAFFDEKRDEEFVNSKGFTNIFLEVKKHHD